MAIQDIVYMTITPEQAKKWLATQGDENRHLNPKTVRVYTQDILRGTWKENLEPIAINSAGVLKNGQHRLTAIVKANKPCEMRVEFNAPDDAVYDKGLKRSVGDALYMRGVLSKDLSQRAVMAIANKYLEITTSANVHPDDEVGDFVNQYGDLILESIAISRKGTTSGICRKATVQTAIFGALKQGVRAEKLYEFISVVNSGFMTAAYQSSAIVLRNFLLGANASGNRKEREDICSVTENAIKDFVEGTPRKRQYVNAKHIYVKKGDAK